MDIYILRDGKEIGPFSEETTQTLLKQGSVLISDLAWRPGVPQWIPLHSVLYPAPAAPISQRPPPPPVATISEAQPKSTEPATARQKAFLSYIGIPCGEELTKEEAALLVNEAMENPKDTGRLTRWNIDRLRLHPDLFAAEIQSRKDHRAEHFYDVAQTAGAECFTKVTKAHCQVLVAYLDVRSPNWDANEEDATWHHFFPAVAEKFPQLVTREWRGKLNYSEGSKVAPELRRRSVPMKAKGGGGKPPLAAAMRGLFIGLLVLGVLWGGWEAKQRGLFAPGKRPVSGAADATSPVATEVPEAVKTGESGESEATPAQSVAPEMRSPTDDSMNATAPAVKSTESAPVGDIPVLDLSAPSPGATAATPGFPPAPVNAAKTGVVITKTIDVRLPFGSVKLYPGTPLKLVGREGNLVRAKYGNDVVTIPVSATDLEQAAPPPASLF